MGIGDVHMKNKALDHTWDNIETIILYGMGLVASRYIDKIMQDFQIPFIIDYNKKGINYCGIPIVGYETVKEDLIQTKSKIVVMTSQRVYCDIRNILEADGFIEGKDFCRIEQFAVEWYWTNRSMINVIQVNTAVTTYCSLNCEKCNMFMPYYDNGRRRHYSFWEMRDDIDLLLSYVDYLFCYDFLGGEPFLNKELKDIIAYIGENYSHKIGRMGVTTNGTIIPDDETLSQLKKYHVLVSISDYTKTVPYKEKVEDVINIFREWGISYTRNLMTEWKDFGFPKEPFHWDKDNVCAHMKSCSPLFHGINDRKLYYCHVIWSVEKAGLYTVPKQDYIDLTKLDCKNEDDRKRISNYCMGECERGFLGFCMVCGGCGIDNTRIIPVGVQMERNLT